MCANAYPEISKAMYGENKETWYPWCVFPMPCCATYVCQRLSRDLKGNVR